ncbi:endonuclease/exonuclease/phosphatase family protein [Longispora albida]|uniref:endonuclease/exonuclease/phosphatase family protein n=1 Tax=Longispora albida TaxID=203523 RepID=UPI00036E3E38|nr:endonuclease/exonuclease/phosphatase family protein [Longispora albida]
MRAALPALALACLLAGHGLVPNAGPRLGSLLEIFLPWLGLGVPVLLVCGRRSPSARAALAVLSMVWLALFGGQLTGPGPAAGLTVVQHNVSDENPDPAGTARALLAAGPDLIALEEVVPGALCAYQAVLGQSHPFHGVRGTVGLWSRYPLSEVRTVDIRPAAITGDWSRGLRAVASTPRGDVTVYVAHLPSIRLGPAGLRSALRDESARLLGAALAAEPPGPLIVAGDFNATLGDRGLAPVTGRAGSASGRFAFSWPASFPAARIDHVMARSATVADVWVLPATGSDHLPVAATVIL